LPNGCDFNFCHDVGFFLGCKGTKIYLDIKVACSFFLILHCDSRKKEQAGDESGESKGGKKGEKGVSVGLLLFL
jgi:hypothetical protein